MRPVPIPDALVPPGCVRKVIGPPDGDLTSTDCGTVEVAAGLVPFGDAHVVGQAILIALEPGDLERLADCEGIWLTLYTAQLPMFAIEPADGGGS